MPHFRVTVDGLNLREGPGTNNPVKTELFANAVVDKLEASPDGKWFRVKTRKDEQDFEGWIAARFVVQIEAEPTVPPGLAGDGWLTRIGDFAVRKAEIPRPKNAHYYNNSHTQLGVLHTTESDTVQSAFVTLRANHSAPHFIAGENQILQCRPINKQAAALRAANVYNPNTDAALQIEMVGRSKQSLWLPAEGSLRPVVAIMRWAAGDPLNIPLQRPLDAWLDDCSDCKLPWAVSGNSRRLAKNIWPKSKGWYMHMEVPLNNHWDCGALRIREILAIAAQP
jgi:hypothetical protein